MDEDDAEIDACKVEHLISPEARGRMVGFLGSVLSDEAEAQSFLRFFKERAVDWKDGARNFADILERPKAR